MNYKQIILLIAVFTIWILYGPYMVACFGVGYFLKDALDYLE